MPDTSIVIKDATGVEYPIDVRSIPGGDTRQVLLIGDGENPGLISPATEGTLQSLVSDLAALLAAGAGDVANALVDNRKTVPVPGGAVAIVTVSTPCKWVQVTALTNNTQQVNVGGPAVLATSGASTGTPLAAGQSTTIPVNDAAKVFVDARVAGEGVSFTVGS